MEGTLEHCVLGRHQSCSEERIAVLSDTIERHHFSRNTSSLLYFESCQDGNWRSYIRESICVTSASSQDLLETWLDEKNWVQKSLNDQVDKLCNNPEVSNRTNQFQTQVMIERGNPLSAVTQVTSQVTSNQCWTRWTLTPEYLDCHILWWNKLRTLVFVNWSRDREPPSLTFSSTRSTTTRSLQPVQYDDKANDSGRGQRRAFWTVRDGP